MAKVLLTLVLLYLHLNQLEAQEKPPYESPCPRLFQYEKFERDQWHGIVTLVSDVQLAGVWLRLHFDKPSLQLGNWFGKADPREGNKDYLISNRNVHLEPNVPQTIPFFIRFNPDETPPKLIGFRLNANPICPEDISTETTPEQPLFISGQSGSTPAPAPPISKPANVPDRGSNPATNEVSFRPQDNAADLNEICGTVVQPTPLITHGQPTTEGEFPWHVAIYHTKGINLIYWSGGSLITRRHIITAAHAVTKWKTNLPRKTNNFVIYLGKYYLNHFSSGIQERLCAEITPHPDFNPTMLTNDIAIVKLSSPVDITEYVRPICLWRDPPDFNSIVDQLGTVVGWGFDESGKLTEKLMQAKMPVASFEKCAYSLPVFYSHFLSNKSYCAGFRNGTSVCNGDSGGGMVFRVRNSNQVRWQLRGLVSVSVDLTNKFKCDPYHFVIFTDIVAFSDWIKQTIQQK